MNNSNSFFFWILSFKNPINTFTVKILALVATVSLLISGTTLILKVWNSSDFLKNITPDDMLVINSIIHIILLFALVWFIPKYKLTQLTNNKDIIKKLFKKLSLNINFEFASKTEDISDMLKKTYERANFAIHQFLKNIRNLIYAWLGLYIVMVLKLEVIKNNSLRDKVAFLPDMLEILFNNLASLYLIFCFIILSVPSKKPLKTHIPHKDRLIASLIILTVIELFFRFFFSDEDNGRIINITFHVISGLVAAVAISLVVGRLDSKLISNMYVTPVLMYLYAAIQALFFVFIIDEEERQWGDVAILYSALFLKLIFFLFIYWSVHFHKLFYYFIKVRDIHINLERDWNETEYLLHDPEAK